MEQGMSERIPTAYEMYFGAHTDANLLEALERSFFRHVGLPNGTWKTTSYRRLDDLNALVMDYLPRNVRLEIMDVAVSSGVSTVEWLEALERAGIECEMIAGDAFVNTFLLSMFGGRLRWLVDRRGRPLQYEVNGRVLIVPLRKRIIPRYFWAIGLMRAYTWLLAPTLRDATRPGARRGVEWHPLQLVSPTLRNRKHLVVLEDDILVDRGYDRRFHVLRAANILNRGYFDAPVLRAMLANLRERLRDGGLLVVCRTEKRGGINNGTVFQLDEARRLRVVARLNAGSEVETLALELPPQP
jgi:hypothetical protein